MCLALVKVILFIVSLAFLRTILDLLAGASDFEERSLVATLALTMLSRMLSRVFVIFENEGAFISSNFHNNEVCKEAKAV